MADQQLKDFATISSIASDDILHVSDTSDSGNDKAATVANIGIINVYVQSGTPGTSGIKPNSIWIDTDDSNKFYVFNSGTSTWVDRSRSGAGSVALTDLENIDQYEFLGRDTSGTGSVEALTLAEVQTVLNQNQWLAIARINNIADDRVLGNVSGVSAAPSELTAGQLQTLILTNNLISDAMLVDMDANSIKANPTGSSADPQDLAIAASKFPARGATGNLEAKDITTLALSLLADSTTADMKATLGLGTYEVTRSYQLGTRGVTAGTFYVGGFYEYATADANLTNASLTQVLGTANTQYAAQAFIVAGAGGTTDGSDLVLTVTGTSLADDGTRTGSDSEILVADATISSTDQYYQTTKKWVGQVTFTLSSTGGATFSYDFNYGFARYEDFSNNNFTVTGLDVVGLAGANDSSFDVILRKHGSTGWTYAATGFAPTPTVICQLSTDNGTENDLATGEYFSYKRNDLNTAVDGDGIEGVIVEVVTATNDSIQTANISITATRPLT